MHSLRKNLSRGVAAACSREHRRMLSESVPAPLHMEWAASPTRAILRRFAMLKGQDSVAVREGRQPRLGLIGPGSTSL